MKDCEAGKHLACLHSKDEEAIGVVHLDTCPAESSTDIGAPGHESPVFVCCIVVKYEGKMSSFHILCWPKTGQVYGLRKSSDFFLG